MINDNALMNNISAFLSGRADPCVCFRESDSLLQYKMCSCVCLAYQEARLGASIDD